MPHHVRTTGLLTALLAASFLIGTAGPAAAAWEGSETIRLGDSVVAEFGGIVEPEIHDLHFFAPEGTFLTAKLKVDKGASLDPMLRLFTRGGMEVDISASLQDKGNKLVLKKFPIPDTDHYYFRITAEAGTGEYQLKTKGKFTKKVNYEGAFKDIDFAAVGGSLLTAKVKSGKGSAAIPVITGVDGPAAVDIGAEGNKIKKVLIPEDGTFTLLLRNDGGAGEIKAKLKMKAPKGGETHDLGAVVESVPDVPNLEAWEESPHADETAEAFRHWDEDGEISTSCAKCHSTSGYRDFIGADGTAFGSVENAAPLGEVISCIACHNSAAEALSSVEFPSGEMVTGLNASARCMQCHQGRQSTPSVIDHIAANADPMALDTVDEDLSFRNVHYLAAAATLYGTQAKGGFEYEEMDYEGMFPHVAEFDSCIECHDAHSLEVRIDACADCHTNVVEHDDLYDIRMPGSVEDYDGDANTDEGIRAEIAGLAEILLAAIQDYAVNVAGTPIVYEEHHPYFFDDQGNSYGAFTPRLLKATYNYQYWAKDPGAFAHNAKYVIELLYDSIADLDAADGFAVPALADLTRNDPAHLDSSSEAFRHWDEDGEVSSSCARCHSVDGLDFYLEWGVDITKGTHPSDGLTCQTCHADGAFQADPANPPVRDVEEVTFPSGVTVENTTDDPSFLCMTCHQGRESKTTVDEAIAEGSFSFRNIHYLAAGPTLFGSEAGVGYEYMGKAYVGKWMHAGGTTNQCVYCHLEASDHSFQPMLSDGTDGTPGCTFCHPEAGGDIEMVRRNRPTDYDGDGSNTEKLSDEVASFGNRLFAALQEYATAMGNPIVYDSHAYPYFFNDTDGDGVADPEEASYGNRYTSWDAPMMKAAFNFQMWQKEPGTWAHNTHYILQLLFDSIEDLDTEAGGLTNDTTGFTRP